MNCERCLTVHDGTYGSGRFCSVKCARSFSSFQKREEINRKVGNKLRGRKQTHRRGCKNLREFLEKECPVCSVKFRTYYSVCCSNSCARKLRYKDPEKRAEITQILRRVRKSWASRKKCSFSFPEKCVKQWLDELNIQYEREFKFQKWFVDFAIHERKIALEVDGKQHNLEEQQRRDKEKDQALQENGWQVVRIKWKRLTSQSRKEIIAVLQGIAQLGSARDLGSRGLGSNPSVLTES